MQACVDILKDEEGASRKDWKGFSTCVAQLFGKGTNESQASKDAQKDLADIVKVSLKPRSFLGFRVLEPKSRKSRNKHSKSSAEIAPCCFFGGSYRQPSSSDCSGVKCQQQVSKGARGSWHYRSFPARLSHLCFLAHTLHDNMTSTVLS